MELRRGPRLPLDALAAEPGAGILRQFDSGGSWPSLVQLSVDFGFGPIFISLKSTTKETCPDCGG